MKKIVQLLITLSLSFMTMQASADHKNNYLIPTGRIVLNPEFCDGNVAAAVLGEAGKDNARLNGTLGFALTPCQSLKIGGEYLSQKLKYNYLDGKSKRWVQQWAVGGKYLALFDNCFVSGVVVDGYYSRADSRKLKTHVLSSTQNLKRRIAGSHAFGGEAGLLFKPWCGAELTLLADYDRVKFQRRYQSNHDLNGFGFSAIFNQKFFDCFDLNLEAEWKKPYDNYTARLLYAGNNFLGPFTIGLFGGYTHGKSCLPNVAIAGIELGLSFGARSCSSPSPCNPCCCETSCRSAIATWVLEPAVYMPIVLAVRDQRTVSTCQAPALVASIPNVTNTTTYDVSPYFSGSNLSWSVISDNPGITASIDAFGVVTLAQVIFGDINATITVTATNECGSVQDSFIADYQTV